MHHSRQRVEPATVQPVVMWTPALGRFWRKKLKKQFDLDGINENAEAKAARAKGVGAHLHLQMYLSEDLNFTKFIQNHGLITSTAEQSIPLDNMEIVNAFNYMETYKNEK